MALALTGVLGQLWCWCEAQVGLASKEEMLKVIHMLYTLMNSIID